MGKKDNLVTGILSTLILAIFMLTIFFCLDLFGIINVPDEYSLVRILSSVFVTSSSTIEVYEEQVTEDTIDDWMNSDDTTDEIVEEEPEEEETHYDLGEFYNSSMEVTTTTTAAVETEVTSDEENDTDNVVNRMYYSQLDVYGKTIYMEFRDNIDNLKTGTYLIDFDTTFNDLLHEDNGAEVLESAFQYAINAFLFDHPEVFYIDVTKIYMTTETSTFGPLKTYRIRIGPLDGQNYLADYFENEAMVENAITTLENNRDAIESNITSTDVYTQVKAVHDYLINIVSYDTTVSESNIYTAYGAITGRLAVCEGYSKAFKYILDDMNIPCIIVCGTAQNSNNETETHAWNYVKISNKWYAVDVTWDDPIITGTGTVSSSVYTKYFLKGSRDFFTDHTEDGNIVEDSAFAYPSLSEENYGS